MDGLGEPIQRINAALNELSGPWKKLPVYLVNIVFACLFLGVKPPKLSSMWPRVWPQVAYGQIVAWGQYVVGLGLWVFVLGWFFSQFPAMFAGILPVGFEGGHGTAAGMGPVFEKHNWAAGSEFALTSATFGILSAIIVGMVLINWAVRCGHVQANTDTSKIADAGTKGIIPIDSRKSAGKLTVSGDERRQIDRKRRCSRGVQSAYCGGRLGRGDRLPYKTASRPFGRLGAFFAQI
jgi:ESS family glutamate:Na+ symporter